MIKKTWFKPILWIITFEAIGFFLGFITRANIHSWYDGLNKSILTPPGWVFSVVWSIFYMLLAIVAYSLWQQRKDDVMRPARYLFISKLLMNWAWTLLFFQCHWIGFSLVWLLILTCLTLLTICSIKNNQWMKVLLVPYFAWLVFATYLNDAIWLLN